MKVKSKSKKPTFLLIAVLILAILALGLMSNNESSSSKIPSTKETADSSYETPTVITSNKINYKNLIENEDGLLYKTDELSIHLVTNIGIPKLVYLYAGDLEGRKQSDNFFLHIYLKDNTRLLASHKFVNLDFFQRPQQIKINEKQYFVFIRTLQSDSYSAPFIDLSNIAYFNTGRFRPAVGRSLDLKNIIIPEEIQLPQLNTGVPSVLISVQQKDFDKIKRKRANALEKGVHISTDDDLVSGKITIDNQPPTKIDFRLKGDWTDHLKDEKKWSYRIISKGDETVRGMRKFSIQNPRARGLLWEWLFNKVIKDQGLIGLRYDFLNLNIEVTKNNNTENIAVGLMAWEEAFDKILIENNEKREGIILAFDESLYWSDQEREKYYGLEHKTYSKELRNVINAPIKVFNQSKIIADPKLNKQLTIATEMLEGLRQRDYKISEVFDIDKLTTFVALTNLFGGSHGLVWHNLRIYYNPITNKFEPISFDSNSGVKIDEIHHYPFFKQDPVYDAAILKKLKWVSDPNFINAFISKYSDELNALKLSFITEYPIPIDLSILEYNSNYIKKLINPGTLITANLDNFTDDFLEVTINNLTPYDVTIASLQHEDGRTLSANVFEGQTIPIGTSKKVKFPLNEYFINAFVSKKNKKGDFQFAKDYKKLRIAHFINNVEIPRLSEIYPLPKNPDYKKSMALYKRSTTSNYEQFSFIAKQNDTLILKKGNHTLDKNLIIPTGLIVVAEKGFSLDMIKSASLISRAPLLFEGTLNGHIRFFSSDGSGGGLFITNASQKSKLIYCSFENLSNPQSEIWSVSGAVNFHESDVDIAFTTFKNNRCEDGLNIIRSTFKMTDTRFEGTQSDAFDGDFVMGTLERCTFIDSGNDGIDVSGSELTINDITITNPSDKAISAGENSTISGTNIKVSGGEIGVVSKDLSKVNLTDLSIIDTRLGLSAFQKKSEYGVASITISNLELVNAVEDYLIEHNSQLRIDGQLTTTVTNNVIDQMYGKEYGKSSR